MQERDQGLSSSEKLRERPLYVMKFGGTSVGNSQAIERVSDILVRAHSDGNAIIAVISAMSGVTNRLIKICDKIAKGEDIFEDIIDMNDIHVGAISDLAISQGLKASIRTTIRHLIIKLHTDVDKTNNDISPRDRDRILSYGERLSVRIVAERCKIAGVPADAVDASNFIVTDETFGEANVDFDKTEEKAKRLLGEILIRQSIPIVTGFIGSTQNGEITTLGRDGSDFSAAIIGRVLNAKEVIIWKDVDGIFTGDPNKDPNAVLIDKMTFIEADQNVIQRGAKVLNRRTLLPLMDTTTDLRVKNTFKPDYAGTLITHFNS